MDEELAGRLLACANAEGGGPVCDALEDAATRIEQFHKEVEKAFKDGFVSGFDHRGRTDDPDEAVAGAEREWAARALTEHRASGDRDNG